ncbi:MAG: hypothetical protein ACLFUR_00500 [Candidatus Hadarchaeia archaeon]
MSREKKQRIRESAEEIVESFKEAVEDLPKLEETYYGQETTNELRKDEDAKNDEELKKFRKNFFEVMPSSDEKGNLKVEVAEWA